MTFEKAYNVLLSLPRFADQGAAAYHPGLQRMETLMQAMGHPHKAFESVHIAGTNGKGSTASMLAAIATASGKRVGLHTSPHLFHFTERLRIDGVPASEAWVADAITRLQPVLDEVQPSFFEAVTALSFLYFAEQEVDLAVVEVGLGGRLDATNILAPRLAIITSIARDHTAILGDTLPEIAREKAGIIKPETPVLTAVEAAEVVAVLHQVALAQQAPFHLVSDEVQIESKETTLNGTILHVRTPTRYYENLQIGLLGPHQYTNAMLAIRAAEMLFDDVSTHSKPIYTGLREIARLSGLRGRLEVLQDIPLILADVGHNAESLEATMHFVASIRQQRKGHLYVLLGLMRDKDLEHIAHLLTHEGVTIFPVSIPHERALSAAELAARLQHFGINTTENQGFSAFVTWFQKEARAEDMLLVTGSHQVVAQLSFMNFPKGW